MIRRLRQLCCAILLVASAGACDSGQREAVQNVEFATLRIDRLPPQYAISRYELSQCASDLDESKTPNGSKADVIEARIERSDGKTWAHVYQMLPPEEGGSVACASAGLEIPNYCGRSPRPTVAACSAMSFSGSSVEAYRVRPRRNGSRDNLYTTLDGTLVAFLFASEPDWDEIGQALEAMESMTGVEPSDLLRDGTDGPTRSKLWGLLRIDRLWDLFSGDRAANPNERVGSSNTRRVIIEKSPVDIEVIEAPVQSDCTRILDDGSVVGPMNMRVGQNGSPRLCDP